MARLIKGNRYLDLFHYETNEDRTWVVHRAMKEDSGKYGSLHYYHDIFPLKKCMLGGVRLMCPANPLKVLETIYGKDAVIPNHKCVNSKWITV